MTKILAVASGYGTVSATEFSYFFQPSHRYELSAREVNQLYEYTLKDTTNGQELILATFKESSTAIPLDSSNLYIPPPKDGFIFMF